jgi:hypothetical protein
MFSSSGPVPAPSGRQVIDQAASEDITSRNCFQV